jgi:hypothetical protein
LRRCRAAARRLCSRSHSVCSVASPTCSFTRKSPALKHLATQRAHELAWPQVLWTHGRDSIPGRGRGYSLRHHVYVGSWACPAAGLVSTGGKVAVVKNAWKFSSIPVHGVVLKTGSRIHPGLSCDFHWPYSIYPDFSRAYFK